MFSVLCASPEFFGFTPSLNRQACRRVNLLDTETFIAYNAYNWEKFLLLTVLYLSLEASWLPSIQYDRISVACCDNVTCSGDSLLASR